MSTYDIEMIADFLVNSLEHFGQHNEAIDYMKNELSLDEGKSKKLIKAWYELDAKDRLNISMNLIKTNDWVKQTLAR